MSKNICIVAGARPNFIKVAPVIRAIRNAQKSGVDVEYQLVYTGRKDDQHWNLHSFQTWIFRVLTFSLRWIARI